MSKHAGAKKTELIELPRVGDRISFIYIEHSKIHRKDSAIIVKSNQGVAKIPAAMISCLLLGPGTDISHRAMELIGDTGTTILWVGENGVRLYAQGRALSKSSRMIEKQAELVSNNRKRLAVAKKMYGLRFPEEDLDGLTMQQLRGREGARIRKYYRIYAKKYDIEWIKREYASDDFESGTPVNKALSVANTCLYGLSHSVITGLGLSPGLGFIHAGHELSFVYDIADLYKADSSIPLSFEIASHIQEDEDISRVTRLRMRDYFRESKLIKQIVKDIQYLINEDLDESIESDVVNLWDDKEGWMKNGINYSFYD